MAVFWGHCSSALMLPQHVHTLKQSLNSSVGSGSGCIWRCGLVPQSMPWQVFRSSEAMCIFWMSSRLLYYCFIHRAWTNYFNSSLHWGVDWQLPSLEWSVCFLDSAEAIWCILTIIGATATMMFTKPLCHFPEGCPWGILSSWSVYRDAFGVGTDGWTAVLCRSQTPQSKHHYHHLKGHTVSLPVSSDEAHSCLQTGKCPTHALQFNHWNISSLE